MGGGCLHRDGRLLRKLRQSNLGDIEEVEVLAICSPPQASILQQFLSSDRESLRRELGQLRTSNAELQSAMEVRTTLQNFLLALPRTVDHPLGQKAMSSVGGVCILNGQAHCMGSRCLHSFLLLCY